MRLYINIIVDSNDADYLELTSEINSEDLEIIKPLLASILKKEKCFPYGENYPRLDMGEDSLEDMYSEFDENTLDTFKEYCPYGEHGFHKICSVEIFNKVNREILI